jgi:peptidoglycan/LPS O-acetylase OafA/YrhL
VITRNRYPHYRPDVDGLRGIAVLSVVGFHAFPAWIKGGFVGVDVFFVISGYIISRIIFNSMENGGFSYTDFYIRRIKRLFPALILLLVSCYAFGWFALLADEYKELGKHITAGSAFVSNFVLWGESGYFDTASENKPLLHLWTLGIEEQFYLVWPLLVALTWKRGLNPGITILVLVTFSFAWNIGGESDPVARFYLPFARFWELMAGSALAWVHTTSRGDLAGTGGYHAYKAAAGALLIGTAVFGIDKEMSFPGWLALLPTAGTLLLVSAGPHTWLNRKVLSHRATVFVGLISYPLYLWHWPLLSFAHIVESGTPTKGILAIAIVASFVLAWLTWRFVEKPIRSNQRLSIPITLSIVMAAIAGVGYWTYREDGLGFRIGQIREFAEQFVNIPNSRNGCEKYFPVPSTYCFTSIGARDRASPTILAIGDSHARILSYGYISALEKKKISSAEMLSIGNVGCLPFIGVERFIHDSPKDCQRTLTPVLDLAKEQFIGHVLIVARYAAHVTGRGYGPDDAPGKFHIQAPGPLIPAPHVDYSEIFSRGLRDTLTFLASADKKIVFVHQVPELGFDPRSCIIRPLSFSGSHDCRIARTLVEERQASYRSIVDSILVDFPNVGVFDPMKHLCDETYCHAVIDGKMMYRDWQHISVDGAEYLSEKMSGRIH